MQAPKWDRAQSVTWHHDALLNKVGLPKLLLKTAQEIVYIEGFAASHHLQLLLIVKPDTHPKWFSNALQFISATLLKVAQLLL